MSIHDCIDAYLSLSDSIFQKKRHRVTVKGDIQGRFDSDELARAVQEVISAQGLPTDTLLKDISESACKVKETSETVCLMSSPSPRGRSDLLDSVKIWGACGATSAASLLFDAIAVCRYGGEFVDGATGANNPVGGVKPGPTTMGATTAGWEDQTSGVNRHRYPLKSFRNDALHIGKTLVAIATETEQMAERFHRDKTHLDDTDDTSGSAWIASWKRLEWSSRRSERSLRRPWDYVGSRGVLKQMQACANNIAGREC
ncbi:phospholipase [Calycina marina]|uniref:Phospholipase n=1 Tax=Calycina marina TaxID=1763456 RepID=A0A9P8CEL4_9HELO|nr:phospholipase [Calycina marina]